MSTYSLHRPFLDLRLIFEITDTVLPLFGICLCTILFYLIIKKTSLRLQDYKKILLQNCVADTIYTVATFVTKTQPDNKNGNFYFVMTDFYGPLSDQTTMYIICFFVLALWLTVTTIPTQFIYRYFLIVKSYKIEGRKYLLMLLISILPPIIYIGISLYAYWPDEAVYAEKAKLLEADVFYFRGRPNFVTADIREGRTVLLFAYATVMCNVSYSIIIWANYKVWKYLKSMEGSMSKQTKEAHKQVTRTLIIQATIPLIILFIPITVNMTMTVTRTDIPGVGIALQYIVALVPPLNPLVTLMSIEAYRKTLIRFIKGIFKKSNEISPSVQVISVSGNQSKNTSKTAAV